MKKKPSLLLRPFNLRDKILGDTERKDLLFLACADGKWMLVMEDLAEKKLKEGVEDDSGEKNTDRRRI